MEKIVILLLALILRPQISRGEIVLVRNVTHSDAVILLNDKKLLNKRVELISSDGEITVGKLRGMAGSSLLLKDVPSVPICRVRLVRISRKTAGPLRHGVGLIGGIVGGALVGGPVAFGIAVAGAEIAAVATYMAFPVIGGIVGSKLARKNEDSLFILDREPKEALCEGADEVSELAAK